MTTRQAKHNAKRRLEGAVTIAVTFRADEHECAKWAFLVKQHGGPKQAMRHLLKNSWEREA